jgi:hypothetical protein
MEQLTLRKVLEGIKGKTIQNVYPIVSSENDVLLFFEFTDKTFYVIEPVFDSKAVKLFYERKISERN